MSEVANAHWKWASRFMDAAKLVASWSKDPTTKVGAVAVNESRQILSTGYNGLPRGVLDDLGRMERPAKYLWTVHAEANLIAHAARHGISLKDSTVYCTHPSCSQCAALLIQAGVASLIVGPGTTSMDPESFEAGKRMFQEAGKFYITYQHDWAKVGGQD